MSTWYTAKQLALPTISSEAHWNTAAPGRMTTSTPMKPTITASTRESVTFSPSIGPARMTTISGAVNEIDAACAIGTNLIAVKNRKVEVISMHERKNCTPGRFVSTMRQPVCGTNNASTKIRWLNVRAQTTCSEE